MKIKYLSIIVAFIGVLLMQSCSETYLDTQPTDRVSSSDVYTSTKGGISVLNGIYRYMYSYNTYDRTRGRHDDFGQHSINLALDVMSDDMPMTIAYFFTSDYNYLYTERDDYSRTHMIWNFYYDIVNNANGILDNQEAFQGEPEEVNYVVGQAYALRAYAYYYLVNLYQHTYKGNENKPAVPLYTTQSPVGDEVATVQEVYNRITSDLDQAVNLLDGASSQKHPSHISVHTARAIYARVAMTMEDWKKAEEMASAAKAGGALMSQADYKSGFNSSKNSEWLWGFNVNTDDNPIYPSFYSHMDPNQGGYGGALGNYKQINQRLYDAFPDTDVRKQVFKTDTTFIKTEDVVTDTSVIYSQYKFISTGTFLGDLVMQRVAEAYLIEAEAMARQNNFTGAQQVLFDLVSARNSKYEKSTSTGQDLIDEIVLNSRIELWGEGRRWLDIKRMKVDLDRSCDNLNESLARYITLPAGDDHFIFPIPRLEKDVNDLVEPNK